MARAVLADMEGANNDDDPSSSLSSKEAADFLTHTSHSHLTTESGLHPNLTVGEDAQNTPNRCSNFVITLDEEAYLLAEKNKKVVATYDTGCTRSLQGAGRIPNYCLRDVVVEPRAAVYSTPSGSLTTKCSITLPAELIDDETGERFWVWFTSNVADKRDSPLLIAGSTMGFIKDEYPSTWSRGRIGGRSVRTYMQHGVPRICFRYPTQSEYQQLCAQGRPSSRDFEGRQMMLVQPHFKVGPVSSAHASYVDLEGAMVGSLDSDNDNSEEYECEITPCPESLDDTPERFFDPAFVCPEGARKLDLHEVREWHKRLVHPGAVRLYSTLVVNGLSTTQAVALQVTKTCEVCQKAKSFRKSTIPRRTPQQGPVAEGFNDKVAIDLLQVLVTKVSKAVWYACTVTDLYSRYIQIYFIHGKKSGQILRLFRSRWVGRFSIPSTLRLDNGREFFGLVDWCSVCGVKIENTSPHGPTGNAICERQHALIMDILRCLLLETGFPPRLDIIRYLLEIVVPFAINNTTNMSHELKKTPGLMAGRATPLTHLNFKFLPGQKVRYIADVQRPKIVDRCNLGRWIAGVHAGECVIFTDQNKVVRIHPSKVHPFLEDKTSGRTSTETPKPDLVPAISDATDRPLRGPHPEGEETSSSEEDAPDEDDENDSLPRSRSSTPPPTWKGRTRSTALTGPPRATTSIMQHAGCADDEEADTEVQSLKYDDKPDDKEAQVDKSGEKASVIEEPKGFVPRPLTSTDGPRRCCHPHHVHRHWPGPALPGTCPFGLCRFCCLLYQDKHPELGDSKGIRRCKAHKYTRPSVVRYLDRLLHRVQEEAGCASDSGNMPDFGSDSDSDYVPILVTDLDSDDDNGPGVSEVVYQAIKDKSGGSTSRSQGVKVYRKKSRNEVDPKSVDPKLLQESKDKEISGWTERNAYSRLSEQEGVARIKGHKAVLIDHRWVVTKKVVADSPTGDTKIKARAVLKGFQDQRKGVSRNAPTAPAPSVKLFWYLAQQYPDIAMGDIAQAFLSSRYEHPVDVLMRPLDGSSGFWLLNAAVYGLGDAPQRWYKEFVEKAEKKGWHRLTQDPCVFVLGNKRTVGNTKPEGHQITALMLLFVDDTLCAGPSPQQLLTNLSFPMGKLKRAIGEKFLGIETFQTDTHLRLKQEEYILSIKVPPRTRQTPVTTPLPVPAPSTDDSPLLTLPSEVTRYRGYVGEISYAAGWTRPDLAYAAHFLSRSSSKPTKQALNLAIRTVHYAKATANYGISIPRPQKNDYLLFFVDASVGALANDRRSQSGYILGIYRPRTQEYFPLSWKSKMQGRIRRSSMSAELWALEMACNFACYFMSLAKEMGGTLKLVIATDALDVVAALNNLTTPKDKMLIQPLELVRLYMRDFSISVKHITRDLNIADELTASRLLRMLPKVLSVTAHPTFALPTSMEEADLLVDVHDVSRPLAWEFFSGTKSATSVLEQFYNVITVDIDMVFQSDVVADVLHLDFEGLYERCLLEGLGPVALLIGYPPCNSWTIMRNLKGRKHVDSKERRQSALVVECFLRIKEYCERRLAEISGRKLVFFMETPATGMLPAYMAQNGWLDKYDITRHDTSHCRWSNDDFNYSKPTAIYSNIPLSLRPVCSLREPCVRRGTHLDVRSLSRHLTYRLPPGLILHLTRAAQRAWLR